MSDVITELANEANDKAAEIARLKAENAKLREEFNKMDVWHSKELTAAMAENAKLRELVRDMWLHSYCSIAKTREDDDRHIEDVIDRMRELGVEV